MRMLISKIRAAAAALLGRTSRRPRRSTWKASLADDRRRRWHQYPQP
jgi:hypothetical protein